MTTTSAARFVPLTFLATATGRGRHRTGLQNLVDAGFKGT
ncbi:MAG: hypothetical protein FD172_3528 [Methylocystaceae bacterium]|nr:MAG: hypothetical protein FD172_3528 [Methylocystaceae bacterium]